MGFQLLENSTDLIRFISTADNAVVRETPEQIANCREYLETLDETLLGELRGVPLVWWFSPLTQAKYRLATRNSGASKYGHWLDDPTCYEIFRLCLDHVDNWPEDWPKLADQRVFENSQLVFSRAFVDRIPYPIITEAAQVLFQLQAFGAPNKTKGKGEVQQSATPKN